MATKKATPSKPKGGPSSVGGHQAFRPVLPCGNKLLQQRWDQTYYDQHRQLVRTAKPMVDTKAPPRRNHVVSKWKKEQTLKERTEVINRDNMNLLGKMQKIMHTKGCVDHVNGYVHHSLNQEDRQREQVRVARENGELLKRLEQVEPMYKVSEWIEEWQRKEELANMITSFPNGVSLPPSQSPTPSATPTSTSPRDETSFPKTGSSSPTISSKKGTVSSNPPSTDKTPTAGSKPSRQETKKPTENTSEVDQTPSTSQDDCAPSKTTEPERITSQDATAPSKNTTTSQDDHTPLNNTEPNVVASRRSSSQTHSASSTNSKSS